MKKARVVEIDYDKCYTEKEYNKLYEHAYNSSVWRINNYGANGGKLKSKLREKGYSEEEVKVEVNGAIKQINIIGEVLKDLQEKLLLDDKAQAKRLLESKLEQGVGLNNIKATLLKKEFNKELIEEVIEEYKATSIGGDYGSSGINKSYKRIINGDGYKKKVNDYERRMYVTHGLLRKGFEYEEVKEFMEWLDEGEE